MMRCRMVDRSVVEWSMGRGSAAYVLTAATESGLLEHPVRARSTLMTGSRCARNSFDLNWARGGLIMEQRANAPTFNCDECGSVSIVVEAPLTETSAVRCCGCRAYFGPWCLFLDELHTRLA
jgi:hypothetical protein